MKEYILCAAIKRIKPKDCVRHYHKNSIYEIEITMEADGALSCFPWELNHVKRDLNKLIHMRDQIKDKYNILDDKYGRNK